MHYFGLIENIRDLFCFIYCELKAIKADLCTNKAVDIELKQGVISEKV